MDQRKSEMERLVELFNEDYLGLLGKAASGDYEHLVDGFLSLRDLNEAIAHMLDLAPVPCGVALYPFSIEGDPALLRGWGFNDTQIAKIRAFLERFKSARGAAFEDVMTGRAGKS